VLFVMPLIYSSYQIQVGALSASLKKEGHEVEYSEFLLGERFDKVSQGALLKTLKIFSPDIICFSSYDFNFGRINEISSFVKSKTDTPIIVGGYYASLSPDEVISYPAIDMVCVGEGEKPLSELLFRMKSRNDISGIENLYVKIGNKIYKNRVGRLIEDLDSLPFIDRNIIDYQKLIGNLLDRNEIYLNMMVSRGCPYNCSYCSNHAFKRLYPNPDRYVRYRSPQNVIKEIEECAKQYKFNKIAFQDDMFVASFNWFTDFAKEYRRKFSYPFRCNIRPESAKMETLELLKEMGCETVEMGIESGDERIRREVLRRNITDGMIINAVQNIKACGLRLKTYNMVGIPHETISSLVKTIKMNFKIAPFEVQTMIYYPLKGTDLGERSFKEGWINISKIKKYTSMARGSILRHKNIPHFIIILAKWLNSATALRSGNLNLIKQFFKIFFCGNFLILKRAR